MAMTMSGVPATISMPDSTARASHEGRPYSTIQIAVATASGVAIAIPMTVSRTVPRIGSRKPPEDFWSAEGCGREVTRWKFRYCTPLTAM